MIGKDDGGITLGALLVDLENLHLAMAHEYSDPIELTMLILQNLRAHIKDVLGISVVVGRAYAPFDFATSRLFINDLPLMGIQPVHVLAKPEKNSADLMLTIDCMEFLFRREDIGTFIIVGGDRDYIPVAERIMENARRVFVVCPRHAMSGDLLTIIGEENYLDAITMIPPEQRTPLSWKRIVQRGRAEERTPSQESGPKEAFVSPGTTADQAAARKSESVAEASMPTTMQEVEKLVPDPYELEDVQSCMKLILQFLRDNNLKEVWLSPFFRIMNNAYPLKNNAQRKALLGRLSQLGAIYVEERPRNDDSGTYSVITVNWTHPLVVEMNPG